MNIIDFCITHDCTMEEKVFLANYLIAMRSKEILQAFCVLVPMRKKKS